MGHTFEAAELSLRLFGPIALDVDGSPAATVRSRCADRVLGYLVVQGRPVSRSLVADTIWPKTSSSESLRQSISTLRRALGSHAWRLGCDNGTLSFDSAGADVDLADFYRLSAGDDLDGMVKALEISRNPLLDGSDEPWVLKARSDVRRRRQEVAHRAAHAAAAAGRGELARDLLARHISMTPALEHGWHDLMAMYVEDGDRAAAIGLYNKYCERRKSHDGIGPSPAMVELFGRARATPAGDDEASPPAWPEAPTVGGAVPLTSNLYIERHVDAGFAEALARRESIVRLQGPRQTGKSSILARGLQRARGLGSATFVVEFGRLAEADLGSMDALCRRLAAIIAAQHEEEVDPTETWLEALGAGLNLERFVLRRVVAPRAEPVVIAIDDVDRLFGRPFADEFFALLRSWHESRAKDPVRPWDRLTLALVLATDARLYLRNINHSPFNVGRRVAVEDLRPAEIDEMVRRHGVDLGGGEDQRRFHEMVGGSAYFACRTLQAMAEQGWSVEEVCVHAGRDDGPLAGPLRDIYAKLAGDAELSGAVRRVLAGQGCGDDELSRLRSGGVLLGEPESPRFRNAAIRRYLEDHL